MQLEQIVSGNGVCFINYPKYVIIFFIFNSVCQAVKDVPHSYQKCCDMSVFLTVIYQKKLINFL